MQTAWVMGNQTELLTIDKPDVEGYLTYGGSVYGNESHYPEVVQFKSHRGQLWVMGLDGVFRMVVSS